LIYSFMAGGASGMPRRIADWVQSGFMTIGFSILIFGIILTLGFVFFLSNLSKSSEIKV